MTDQLYRWVKASERLPETGVISFARIDGHLLSLIQVSINTGRIHFAGVLKPTEYPYSVIEWLEPYTPSIAVPQHEQVLQLLITGGFLNPDKLQEARDIIAGCAPEPDQSLEEDVKDKQEKVKYLMGLVRYGWDCAAGQILALCENTKVSPQFTDGILRLLDETQKQKFVYEIFQKHIPETISPLIVDELRKVNPWNQTHPLQHGGYNECCNKLRELLNPSLT